MVSLPGSSYVKAKQVSLNSKKESTQTNNVKKIPRLTNPYANGLTRKTVLDGPRKNKKPIKQPGSHIEKNKLSYPYVSENKVKEKWVKSSIGNNKAKQKNDHSPDSRKHSSKSKLGKRGSSDSSLPTKKKKRSIEDEKKTNKFFAEKQEKTKAPKFKESNYFMVKMFGEQPSKKEKAAFVETPVTSIKDSSNAKIPLVKELSSQDVGLSLKTNKKLTKDVNSSKQNKENKNCSSGIKLQTKSTNEVKKSKKKNVSLENTKILDNDGTFRKATKSSANDKISLQVPESSLNKKVTNVKSQQNISNSSSQKPAIKLTLAKNRNEWECLNKDNTQHMVKETKCESVKNNVDKPSKKKQKTAEVVAHQLEEVKNIPSSSNKVDCNIDSPVLHETSDVALAYNNQSTPVAQKEIGTASFPSSPNMFVDATEEDFMMDSVPLFKLNNNENEGGDFWKDPYSSTYSKPVSMEYESNMGLNEGLGLSGFDCIQTGNSYQSICDNGAEENDAILAQELNSESNFQQLDAIVKETTGAEVKISNKLAAVYQPLESPQPTKDTTCHIEANCNNMSSGRAVVGKAAEGNSSSKNSALSVFSPDINTRENNEQAGSLKPPAEKKRKSNKESGIRKHVMNTNLSEKEVQSETERKAIDFNEPDSRNPPIILKRNQTAVENKNVKSNKKQQIGKKNVKQNKQKPETKSSSKGQMNNQNKSIVNKGDSIKKPAEKPVVQTKSSKETITEKENCLFNLSDISLDSSDEEMFSNKTNKIEDKGSPAIESLEDCSHEKPLNGKAAVLNADENKFPPQCKSLGTPSPLQSVDSAYGSPEFNQNNSQVKSGDQKLTNKFTTSSGMHKSVSNPDFTAKLPKQTQMCSKPSKSAHNSPLRLGNEDTTSSIFKRSNSLKRRPNKVKTVKQNSLSNSFTVSQLAEIKRRRVVDKSFPSCNIQDTNPLKAKTSPNNCNTQDKNAPEKLEQVEDRVKEKTVYPMTNSCMYQENVLNEKSNKRKTPNIISSGYGSGYSNSSSDDSDVQTYDVEDVSAVKSKKFNSKVKVSASRPAKSDSESSCSSPNSEINTSKKEKMLDRKRKESTSSSDSSSGSDSDSDSSDSSDSEDEAPQRKVKETFSESLKKKSLYQTQTPTSASSMNPKLIAKNKPKFVRPSCSNNCNKSTKQVNNIPLQNKNKVLNSKQGNLLNKKPTNSADISGTDDTSDETLDAVASISEPQTNKYTFNGPSRIQTFHKNKQNVFSQTVSQINKNKKQENINNKPYRKQPIEKMLKANFQDKFPSKMVQQNSKLHKDRAKQQIKNVFSSQNKFANKAVHQTAGSHKNQSKQQMKSSALSRNNIKTPTDTNNLLKSADVNTLKRSLARTRTLTSSTDESEDESEEVDQCMECFKPYENEGKVKCSYCIQTFHLECVRGKLYEQFSKLATLSKFENANNVSKEMNFSFRCDDCLKKSSE